MKKSHNMQKVFSLILLSMMFLSLFSFSVLGNTVPTGDLPTFKNPYDDIEGNGGYLFGGEFDLQTSGSDTYIVADHSERLTGITNKGEGSDKPSAPLVCDYDLDGLNEIITYSGQNIKIYNASTGQAKIEKTITTASPVKAVSCATFTGQLWRSGSPIIGASTLGGDDSELDSISGFISVLKNGV